MHYETMTQTNTGKRTKMISFRASDEEIQRIKTLSVELIAENRYLKESDILRELIGLEDTGIITPEIRRKLLPVQPGDELEPIGKGSPNESN